MNSMTLSFHETKVLIDLVLDSSPAQARALLHNHLKSMKHSEPEFCAGVIEHGPSMRYSANQWFDLLSKIPSRALRDEARLMNKLSEAQRRNLPRAAFGP